MPFLLEVWYLRFSFCFQNFVYADFSSTRLPPPPRARHTLPQQFFCIAERLNLKKLNISESYCNIVVLWTFRNVLFFIIAFSKIRKEIFNARPYPALWLSLSNGIQTSQSLEWQIAIRQSRANVWRNRNWNLKSKLTRMYWQRALRNWKYFWWWRPKNSKSEHFRISLVKQYIFLRGGHDFANFIISKTAYRGLSIKN